MAKAGVRVMAYRVVCDLVNITDALRYMLDDGRVMCDVCPRACELHEGQQGLCFVRANNNGEVVLTTYGRSSGYCVDPIEKKPLNHFLPGTPVLSFGTACCNLACKFCQNWDISKSREIDTLADSASPESIASAADKLDCRSVAFTYNDPVIFLEYAIDTAIACREQSIKTVAVTAGYICDEPRREFFSHMDAAIATTVEPPVPVYLKRNPASGDLDVCRSGWPNTPSRPDPAVLVD